MSHTDGLYIVLKDQHYKDTLQDILTQHTDPNRRVAYIANSPDEVYLDQAALDHEGMSTIVIDKAHTIDESSGLSRYSEIALNIYRLSPNVIITDSLDNTPFEIAGMNRAGLKNPYLADGGTNDDVFYPLDTFLNLGTRGTTIILGVDAPDLNAAKIKVYDAAHVVGKALLDNQYEFSFSVFNDEKFGYWAND